MKKIVYFLLIALCLPIGLMAQSVDDDLYFVPSKDKKEKKETTPEKKEPRKQVTTNIYTSPGTTVVVQDRKGKTRDVDEYNRRYDARENEFVMENDTLYIKEKAQPDLEGEWVTGEFDGSQEDYEYAEGEVVRHEGLLYVFTKNHTKTPWVGTDAKPISLNEALLPKISQLLLESSGGITYSATLTNDPTGDSVIPRILPVKAGRIYKISVHSDIPLSDKASVGLGGNGSIIIGNVTEATVYKKATVNTNNARVYMENCTSGANVTVNIRDISTDYTVIPTFELNHEDEYLKPGVYVRNDNASYRDSALMQVSYNNVTKTVTQVVSQIVHGTSNPYIKFRNGTIGEDGNITFESWEPLYLSMAKMSGKWVSNTDPTDTTGLGFYPIYDGNTYEITLKTDSLIGCSISLPDLHCHPAPMQDAAAEKEDN